MSDAERNGLLAYQIYGLTTGNETFSGAPMLQWHELPPIIQQAWSNVGSLMAQSYTSMDLWMTAREQELGIKRLGAPKTQEFKGG